MLAGGAFRPDGASDRPAGLERGASGAGLQRPAARRVRVPESEGRPLAGLGAAASLDRRQDPRAYRQLHAGRIAAAAGAAVRRQGLAGPEHGGTQAATGGVKQVELLYPRQGQKGPTRVASIASKQNLAQQAFMQALDFEELIGRLGKPRGYSATPQPKRLGIDHLQTFRPRSQWTPAKRRSDRSVAPAGLMSCVSGMERAFGAFCPRRA